MYLLKPLLLPGLMEVKKSKRNPEFPKITDDKSHLGVLAQMAPSGFVPAAQNQMARRGAGEGVSPPPPPPERFRNVYYGAYEMHVHQNPALLVRGPSPAHRGLGWSPGIVFPIKFLDHT